MGWDYTVYVKARRRTRDKIRELAAKLARTYEARLVAVEDEDGDDDTFDLGFTLPKGGGRFEVEWLKRGYKLSTDSQMLDRSAAEDIGGLMDLLASKLGTVVADSAAIEALLAEGDAHVAPVAVVRTEDRAGGLIEEITLDAGVVLAAIDAAGMLRDVTAQPSITEEGRYVAKTVRLTATLFDELGNAYRRHKWACDGYGRIISAKAEELAD